MCPNTSPSSPSRLPQLRRLLPSQPFALVAQLAVPDCQPLPLLGIPEKEPVDDAAGPRAPPGHMPPPGPAGKRLVRPAAANGINELVNGHQQIFCVSHYAAPTSSTDCAASTFALRAPPSAMRAALCAIAPAVYSVRKEAASKVCCTSFPSGTV